MQIRVALKTSDLIGLDHSRVTVTSGGKSTTHDARGGDVVLRFKGPFKVEGPKKTAAQYRGSLHIKAHGNSVRLILETDLEDYVKGVLQSEVPSYFNLEAMKAQAVLARTYGLRPRLPHEDGVHVCDSYMHCQAFYGVKALTAMQAKAILSTNNQILKYEGKPALALFSACAGGHTEDYQDAFSDPITNAFPPPVIPYLRGVNEGGTLPAGYPDEKALRALYVEAHPNTVDAWSPGHFKWRVVLSADALEAHMHHVVDELRKDPQFTPFIKQPPSGKFGQIKTFEVLRRGVAGTAIELIVHTSEGDWKISKELTIRSAFENPDAKLKRLRSARMFFDHQNDSLGLLKQVTISGFGSGHGVGLQQVGAHGWAQRGKNYREIIEHYYKGCEICPVS
jgi:stage II sporulation protein D